MRATLLTVALVTSVNSSAGAACLDDVRTLYTQMQGFRSSESFNFYGFGQGGPHRTWFERLNQVYATECRREVFERCRGIDLYSLHMIAMYGRRDARRDPIIEQSNRDDEENLIACLARHNKSGR